MTSAKPEGSSAYAIYSRAASAKSGRRLRITAQLVEAETGAHLWADKFDGDLEDVFDLQDRITEQVVGIVEPSVQRSEIERSRRKRPESLDAHDLYLRALPFVQSIDPESAPIATAFLKDALKSYPNFPLAHAYLAWSHQIRFTHAGFDEAEKVAAMQQRERPPQTMSMMPRRSQSAPW